MENQNEITLEFAKSYTERGWKTIPIPFRSKNPNFRGWQNLNLNKNDLPLHFNGKEQNIGVLMGAKSNGLTDVDLDSPEAVKIADFFLPDTKSVFGRISKPKSHRLYYCLSEKFDKFINPFLIDSKDTSERQKSCIVELRGKTGMQTVFPPSIHTSGESIEWHKDKEPLAIAYEDLHRCVALLATACLISTFWKSGKRNSLTLAISGAFLRNGFAQPEVRNFISAICEVANDNELSDRLKAIEATERKLFVNEKVQGFPSLAELTDKKLVGTICKWLKIENRNTPQIEINSQLNTPNEFTSDPKPLDLILKPIKKVEDDCLPQILINWLRPASRVIGCPFDFLVLSAIVMAGSLLGSRVRVKAMKNSDWLVVPNLYGGIVGLPSTKKTPALDETRKPVLELQCKSRKTYLDKKRDFEIENRFYEKQSTRILKESKTSDIYKQKMTELDETKPIQPFLRRFEVNDITASKLIQFLSENPNGLTLFRDELTGWLNSLEADYDKSARSFFLELWKGAIVYELSRVDGREIQLNSGTLSIIGGVQPSKLQKYVSEAYSFNNSDGFLQRFLFVYPDINKHEKSSQNDYLAMKDGFSVANEIFTKLADYDFKGCVVGANGDHFHVVKFDSHAQIKIDKWKERVEIEAEKLQTEDEAFSSFLYKLPKSCFAVALIFHCLEKIDLSVFPDEISEKTITKAINYLEVLKSHAKRVFALGENQIFALANTLIGKIKKGDLQQGFTGREVIRKQWSGLKSKETVQDVLNLLIENGYLRDLQTQGEGRRTIKYYYHSSLEKELQNKAAIEEELIENFGCFAKTSLTETDVTHLNNDLSASVSGQIIPFTKNSEQFSGNYKKKKYSCPNCSSSIPISEDDCLSCGKKAIDF